MKKQNVNILVQYDGGGYNGCFWEWNFFYIDPDGKFENIFSSGRGGIETQEAANDLVENKKNDFSNKVYIYHLDNKSELKEFATETHITLVEFIVRWFNEYNVPDVQPFAICNGCGNKLEEADEIRCESGTILCYECWSMGSCGYCGEHLGKDSEYLITSVEQIKEKWDLPTGVAETIANDYSPICECCAETLLNRELDKLIKATRI